jgi:oligopeptide/dipeptide ABC transporter ATP-binding protein
LSLSSQKPFSFPSFKKEAASPFSIIQGCPFATRCPLAQSVCLKEKPQWQEVHPHHFAACHFL